jgi:hypothetical protein
MIGFFSNWCRATLRDKKRHNFTVRVNRPCNRTQDRRSGLARRMDDTDAIEQIELEELERPPARDSGIDFIKLNLGTKIFWPNFFKRNRQNLIRKLMINKSFQL